MTAAKRAPYAASEPDFWAVIEGYEYALHQTRGVDEGWIRDVRRATEDVYAVFRKVAKLGAALDASVLEEMGFPRGVRPILAGTIDGHPTLFGRFDFIETRDGFRLIEFNAETPYFWVETHRINGLACRAEARRDPNETAQAVVIDTMRAYSARHLASDAVLAVTASNVYREDYFTAKYLAWLWTVATGREVPVVPVHDLRIASGALRYRGRRIDVVHRCYPLEHFAHDPYGFEFLELIEAGALRIINPGAALFSQNKMTQVLIWNLRDRVEIFDDGERRAIEQYFLPSFAEPQALGSWVRKPVFGREGSNVTIIRDGKTVSASRGRYDGQPMIYQAHAQSVPAPIRVSNGSERTGTAVVTCSVAAGRANAVGMRLGGEIIDGTAYFQPISLFS